MKVDNAPFIYEPKYILFNLERPKDMSKDALCIIDMQPRYFDFMRGVKEGSKERLINRIVSLTQDYISKKKPVYVVEFAPAAHEHTVKPILKLVKNYKLARIVTKFECDASYELVKVIKDVDHIRCCGVYAEQCVKQTAIGLYNKRKEYGFEVGYDPTAVELAYYAQETIENVCSTLKNIGIHIH